MCARGLMCALVCVPMGAHSCGGRGHCAGTVPCRALVLKCVAFRCVAWRGVVWANRTVCACAQGSGGRLCKDVEHQRH